MMIMLHRRLLRFCVSIAAFCMIASTLLVSAQDTGKRGRKYKSPAPTARIEVTVLRDANGKPIENAAVVFHPMEGERDKGAMELKTNEDGKTIIDVLPLGDTVRLQIIAKGFQTFGDDYKIDKSEMAIEIKMKRPGEQYSIYKIHDTPANSGQSTVTDKPPDSSKDAAPADKDKPADPPAQAQPK